MALPDAAGRFLVLRQFPPKFMRYDSVIPLVRVLTATALWVCGGASGWAAHSIKIPLTDGFDQPVGKPDGNGYYVFRGFYPNAHMGEDWNGNGGGNSDLGDPVYATADGVVVYSEDYGRSWGNLIIVRHAVRPPGAAVQIVDSVYAHLDKRHVRLYQMVKRGQSVGTIGTAHGRYAAHLHFEIRKNLQIGPHQTSFARDYTNYFSPRQFISQRRQLGKGGAVVVPVDTFNGQGPSSPAAAGGAKPVPVPVRDPREAAKAQELARQRREAELDRIIKEHRKKVEESKDDDLDGFWDRLKTKLGNRPK
jgi:murein DD-endopeptidase MepM/ murein hydrolase activator NlpD